MEHPDVSWFRRGKLPDLISQLTRQLWKQGEVAALVIFNDGGIGDCRARSLHLARSAIVLKRVESTKIGKDRIDGG
jgi:hypothetical protein